METRRHKGIQLSPRWLKTVYLCNTWLLIMVSKSKLSCVRVIYIWNASFSIATVGTIARVGHVLGWLVWNCAIRGEDGMYNVILSHWFGLKGLPCCHWCHLKSRTSDLQDSIVFLCAWLNVVIIVFALARATMAVMVSWFEAPCTVPIPAENGNNKSKGNYCRSTSNNSCKWQRSHLIRALFFTLFLIRQAGISRFCSGTNWNLIWFCVPPRQTTSASTVRHQRHHANDVAGSRLQGSEKVLPPVTPNQSFCDGPHGRASSQAKPA